MNNLLILTLLIVLMTVSFYFLMKNISRSRSVKRRTGDYIHVNRKQVEEIEDDEHKSAGKKYLQTSSKAFKWVRGSKKTIDLLQQAGLDITPAEYAALKASSAAGAAVLVYFMNAHWIFIGAAGLVGLVIPGIVVKRMRKKRLDLLTHQLVETLGTMANSLRAGFSFMQAMKMISEEMPDPIGPEFGRVVRDAALGMPVEDSLRTMVERLPNKELEVIVQAIIAQRESGGNLAELLVTMEDTIRGRVRVLEELRTLTSQGKLSSWIITLLPVGLALFMFIANREYMSPLIDHPLGWAVSGLAVMSIFIGWFLIQKVIRIEV